MCTPQQRKRCAMRDMAALRSRHGHAGDGDVEVSLREAVASKSDKLISELSAVRAKADEVINLASRLWDTGILGESSWQQPLVRAHLLQRLASHCHSATARGALQLWRRRCWQQRLLDELEQTSGSPLPRAAGRARRGPGSPVSRGGSRASSKPSPSAAAAAAEAERAARIREAEALALRECEELRARLRAAQAASGAAREAPPGCAADPHAEGGTVECAVDDGGRAEVGTPSGPSPLASPAQASRALPSPLEPGADTGFVRFARLRHEVSFRVSGGNGCP